MPELPARVDAGGTLLQRHSVLDVVHRAVPPGAPAAAALGARQIVAPAIVVGAPDLLVDEAVDGLVADPHASLFQRQPAGDLFGRPSHSKVSQDVVLQVRLARHARPAPAPRPGLLVGVGRPVAAWLRRIAPQLPCNRRWRAIQSCSDLPDRLPLGAQTGNRTPLLKIEVSVSFSHSGNTLAGCCTSFVKSGNPGRRAAGWLYTPHAEGALRSAHRLRVGGLTFLVASANSKQVFNSCARLVTRLRELLGRIAGFCLLE